MYIKKKKQDKSSITRNHKVKKKSSLWCSLKRLRSLPNYF